MRANRKNGKYIFCMDKNIRPYIIFVLANILKKKTCKEKLNGEKRAAALKKGEILDHYENYLHITKHKYK